MITSIKNIKLANIAFVTIAIVGMAFIPFTTARAAIVETGFEEATVAGGFTLPTAMAFAPDGRIFIAEKGGTVRVIKNGAVLTDPLITLTDINTFGDRGLIGMAVDPNFATNGYVYLSYTYENSPGVNFGGSKTGRIVRVTVEGDAASESSKVVLVGTVGGNVATPSCEDYPAGTDCIPSDSPSHTVGGLRFGLDGKLYATTGDGADFSAVDPRALRSQNVNSLAGKMLRINTDGTAPADNPFYTGDPNANISKVYALGFRNMFRFNFHPTSGMLFGGDVGWSDWEEINKIIPGGNYGWPCVEGNTATSYGCTPSSLDTAPVYVYPHNASGAGSITAGAFPANGAYPAAYNNTLFIGDYAQNWMKMLALDTSDAMISVNDFIPDTTWPVDISTGPDGNVYYIDIAFGELRRITHTTGNRRPVPAVSAIPTSGLAPLSVNFSSAGTVDPDGNPITFSWNFGDGATSNAVNPTHVYTVNGAYAATLTVTDSLGSSASKSIAITVGNQAPSATITNPASGSLYTPGQTINVTGVGTDPEDGALGALAFHWDIILHHNTHVHFIQQFDGVTNPSFIADNHDDPDVYMEVALTVTDSGGLSTTRSINLYMNNGAGAGNLISNPSVEIESAVAGIPEGWFSGWFGVLNPIFTYPVAGFDGTKAMRLELTSYTEGNAKWYFSPVFVTPGEDYNFSSYYTATVPTVQSAQFGFSDGTYQYQLLSNLPAVAAPTPVTHTITIPAGAQTLSVFHEIEQVGVLTTDNFSLTLAGAVPPPPTNLIQNPSLETTGATGDPDKWLRGGWGSNNRIYTYPVAGSEGAKAAKVEITSYTSGDAKWFFEDVAVTPGEVYTISHDYKSTAGTEVLARYTLTGGGFQYQFLGAAPAAAAWTPNTYDITIPANVVSITLFHVLHSVGSLEVDHFSLTTDAPTPDTIPPTASVTAPANGSTVSGSVNVTANATDNVGVVGVTLLVDGVAVLTEDTAAPYTFSWDSATVSNGGHTIAVRARDVAGNETTSTVVNVTVDNTTTPPPTNLIQNPSLETTGATGDPDKWFRGGWGTNNAVFTYPTPGSDGLNAAQVEITAYTDGDAKWFFEEVVVTAGNTYTLSHDYKSTAGTEILARYTLTGGGFQYQFLGAVPAAPAWTPNTFDITIPANVSSMTLFHVLHSVGSLEVDNFSLTDPSAPSDTTPPTAAITAPTEASTVSGSVNVTANATDNVGVTGVTLLIDGAAVLTEDTTAPYTFSWDSATVVNGAHGIAVRARDAAGNETTSAAVNVTVDNTTTTPPENLILNGNFETTNGENPLGWTPNTWGNHTAVHTYPITGFDGNKAARTEITSYPPTTGTGDAKWVFQKIAVTPGTEYTYRDHYRSNTISDIIGQYTLTDSTFHYFGLKKEIQPNTAWQTVSGTFIPPVNATHVTLFHLISAVGFVEIDDAEMFVSGSGTPSETVPPVVEFTNPLQGQTVSGTITLTASSSDNVAVTYIFYAVDGIPITGQITTSPYAFDWDTRTVADGTHTLKATTHDPSGNNSTHTITITVDNSGTPPPTGNLIQNPSLEVVGVTGDPDKWFRGGWGTNNAVFTYPTPGSDGLNAAQVEITAYTDGDAKWFFEDAPVTSGETYTLSHDYKSTVGTEILARYALTGGGFQYQFLGAVPAAPAWTPNTFDITIPANVSSMTLFHVLHSVGSLEVDNYSLGTDTGSVNQFTRGMVSYTFDDAWISHYTDALPVLDAANVDGTFYVVSQETLNALPVELIQNPSLETTGATGDPDKWLRGGWGTNNAVFTYPTLGSDGLHAAQVEITAYTDGDAKWFFEPVTVIQNSDYTISNRYRGTAESQVVAQYTMNDGSVQYAFLGVLPATGEAWLTFQQTVHTPANVSSMTLFHVLASTGTLTVDDYSLQRVQVYLDPAKVLALQAAGHEIGAHTKTHPDLALLTPSAQQDEISGSRTDILGMGASPVDTFAYPLGSYTSGIKTITQDSGYTNARSTDRGYNTKDTDKYALKIEQADRTTTIAEVESWVSQAATQKLWLIIMFHQIDADPAHTLGITRPFLQDIVAHVQTADVDVVTVGQGLAQMNP